jgi:hypothetical protein
VDVKKQRRMARKTMDRAFNEDISVSFWCVDGMRGGRRKCCCCKEKERKKRRQLGRVKSVKIKANGWRIRGKKKKKSVQGTRRTFYI